jgi:hypothetical protein
MTNVQYITDAQGHKTGVILRIEDYEEMLEDLYFGEAARESIGEPVRPFDEIVNELRENGEIDV